MTVYQYPNGRWLHSSQHSIGCSELDDHPFCLRKKWLLKGSILLDFSKWNPFKQRSYDWTVENWNWPSRIIGIQCHFKQKIQRKDNKKYYFRPTDPLQKYVATVIISILIAHSPVADNWNLKSEVYQPQSKDDEDYLRTPRLPSLVPFKYQAASHFNWRKVLHKIVHTVSHIDFWIKRTNETKDIN